MTDTPEPAARRVVFVAGAGRSGTSTMVGLLRILGLHVPQPEYAADESNPKGFGEPTWVIEHHDRLLGEALVQVNDSRPDAWADTARLAEVPLNRQATAAWLAEHFADRPMLVVKDPRLSWFLPMWRQAALDASAAPGFVTMLRPPAEVVGSKQTYYGIRHGAAHLAASWLNMMLHTELLTRPGDESAAGRCFVRYADLLGDWTSAVARVGESLGLAELGDPSAAQVAEGDAFVDPSLRRMTLTLDDLALPPRLHELTVDTWTALDALAEPGADTPDAHAELDRLRAAYVDLYGEAEAISRSTVVAARLRLRRELERSGAEDDDLDQVPARSRADLIPHELRARIPAGVRRRIRRIVPRR